MVRAYPVDKEHEMKCTIIIFLALLFSLPPAAAQDEGVFEGRPTDFLPLQVGNQWTYVHRYENYAYGSAWWERNPEIRMLFEIPGYPYDNDYPEHPPYSLLRIEREFTIEITHTEMIDGLEYFVFSHADYDWPPIPNLFWAGQQVRLSDEGVLLFRWNGQDVPLYDLNPQHPSRYSISAYPIREDVSTKLDISRRIKDGQIIFDFLYPELPTIPDMDVYRNVFFQPRYGVSHYAEEYYEQVRINFFGGDFTWGEDIRFAINLVRPIQAIISGEAVSYEQALRGEFDTHVQSSSWGQLKRAFRPWSPFTY